MAPKRPPAAVSRRPSARPSVRAGSGLTSSSAALSAATGVPPSRRRRARTRPVGELTRRMNPPPFRAGVDAFKRLASPMKSTRSSPPLARRRLPVGRRRLDRIELGLGAVLEAHRHEQPVAQTHGGEVAGLVEPIQRLWRPAPGVVGEAAGVVLLGKGDWPADAAQLFRLFQVPVVAKIPPTTAVQEAVEAAALQRRHLLQGRAQRRGEQQGRVVTGFQPLVQRPPERGAVPYRRC